MATPPAFRTILVATDFSDDGDAAVSHALRLGAEPGTRVLIVHVLDADPTPNPLYAHYYPMPTPEQTRRAEASALEALRARIPEDAMGSERVETLVLHGVPASEILRMADERKVSLIVIAPRGRSALLRLALGSVADRVIREAPCPVLLVR
jgi:nucleotide-binding universal stress UspA family protein